MATLLLPVMLQQPPAVSPYRQRILSLRPAGYWRLGEPYGRVAIDASGRGRHGAYHGGVALGQPGAIRSDPNTAIGLNGSAYVEIPSQRDFSVTAAGLTVEAWVRPDRLNFTGQTSENYVHWLGKGEAGRFEWGFRFYPKSSPDRPNRISAYCWNPDGNLGAGAYFQETVTPGQWIHVVAVYQPPGKGAGVQIFRNGVFKKGPPDSGTLYSTYTVTPTPGTAPLRLGTRDVGSFLTGGLDEVAIYPRCLTAAEIQANYRLATSGARPTPFPR
jgi:Concanavalin A-like lectin/glucanases superfamily